MSKARWENTMVGHAWPSYFSASLMPSNLHFLLLLYIYISISIYIYIYIEGSLEVKLPTVWTVEKLR